MKNLSIAAILACFLVAGYGGWAKCNAQLVGGKTDPPSKEDVLTDAALEQFYQANPRYKGTINDAAAKALEAMGPKAGKALAKSISNRLSGIEDSDKKEILERMDGLKQLIEPEKRELERLYGRKFKGKKLEELRLAELKLEDLRWIYRWYWSLKKSEMSELQEAPHAETLRRIAQAAIILGNIGKRLADNEEVREALLKSAEYEAPLETSQYKEPNRQGLLMRLAAVEALGKINEHRGGILAEKKLDENEAIFKGKKAAADLEDTAQKVFDLLAGKRKAKKINEGENDEQFYAALKELVAAQPKITKIAARIKVQASLSRAKEATEPEQAESKSTDAKSLESSLRKIYFSYLKATTTQTADSDEDKGKPDWQKKSEAAYDMLTESMLLNQQLAALCEKDSTSLAKDRHHLTDVIKRLRDVSHVIDPDLYDPDPDRELLPEIAAAMERIFSTPAVKTPPADAAKKDETKKDATKKDAAKKDETKPK